MNSQPDLSKIDTTLYANRWIAVYNGQVVGVHDDADAAYRIAKQTRPRREPQLVYLNEYGARGLGREWLRQQTTLRQVIELLRREGVTGYLVGGAIRDLLLGRTEIDDFDFAVLEGGVRVGRRLADALEGHFFALDTTRETGRVIFYDGDFRRITLDFATLRGETLLDDLADRDFTVNAIAMMLDDSLKLIDPHQGQSDLRFQRLHVVSDDSFYNDSLRVLRAVRQAGQFGLTLSPRTQQLMREAAPLVNIPSPERRQMELLKILNTPAADLAMRQLHQLGVLGEFLPKLLPMVGETQTAPHHLDVFEHTLAVLAAWHSCQSSGWPEPLTAWDFQLDEYLDERISGGYSAQQLIPLAILFHDAGKPATRTVETTPDGAERVRFLGHEQESATIALNVMEAFRFSTQATDFVVSLIRHHMRPLQFATAGKASRRAIHRLYRDSKIVGRQVAPAIALHAWVDHLGTYPPQAGQAEGGQLLKILSKLLQAYFALKEEVIEPPPLLTGRDLIALGVPQSRLIGQLLRRLQESQADGDVTDRAEATAFIQADPEFQRVIIDQQSS